LKKLTGKDSIEWLKLDLADVPSCAAAARDLASRENKLDILFCNAYILIIVSALIAAESWCRQWTQKQRKDTSYNGYTFK
jgi:NAD(P)-dependent dehydrogenase (short-subunit alcohol dehydrogenase family)